MLTTWPLALPVGGGYRSPDSNTAGWPLALPVGGGYRSPDSNTAVWSEHWCLPLNSYQCEAFSEDSHQGTSDPTSSHSTLPSASIPLQLFLGYLRLHSFLFKTRIFAKDQFVLSSQGRALYLCFLMGHLEEVPYAL